MSLGIGWFKEQFGDRKNNRIKGTPFSLDFLTAIALQETFYIWGDMYKNMSASEVLRLCVGDTLDAPKRSEFPRNKKDLLKAKDGDRMFVVAREALEALGAHNASYHKIAQGNPNKFCHGFGIFQYDIQYFKTDSGFFFNKLWYNLDDCLMMVIDELQTALRRTYGAGKDSLTDAEMVYVAIAYNKGSANLSKNFKQGHRDSDGKYYGEYIHDYIELSKKIT